MKCIPKVRMSNFWGHFNEDSEPKQKDSFKEKTSIYIGVIKKYISPTVPSSQSPDDGSEPSVFPPATDQVGIHA